MKEILVRVPATDEVAHHVLGVPSHRWDVPVSILALSREAREWILGRSYCSGPCVVKVDEQQDHEPTAEEAATLADAALAPQVAQAQAEREARAQAEAAEEERDRAEAERLARIPVGDPEWRVLTEWDHRPCGRVQQILGQHWGRAEAEARRQAREEREAQEREAQAQAERDRAVVLAWLPDVLRRQAERGLLSVDDTRAALRDAVYPLIVPEDWPRYRRLTSSDVSHDEECYGERVEYHTYQGDDVDLAPSEYARLEALEALVEQARQDPRLAGVTITVEPREHRAYCPGVDCSGDTRRGSARVSVTVGGETLAREYGLTE